MKVFLCVFAYLIIGTICGAYSSARYKPEDLECFCIIIFWPIVLPFYLFVQLFKFVFEFAEVIFNKNDEKNEKNIDLRERDDNDDRKN